MFFTRSRYQTIFGIVFILGCFFISFSIQLNCSKGCLKCLSTGECVICDIKNDYARISGICINNKIDKCKDRNFDGSCLVCESLYFLDFGKCVQVVNTTLTNCLEFFTSSSCQKCNMNYNLKNGKCLLVNEIISNCNLYNSDSTKCLTCNPGFLLNLDQLSCDKYLDGVSNCLSFSQIGCKECKSGFMVDLNKYVIDTGNLDVIEGKRNEGVAITTTNVALLTKNVEKFMTTYIYNIKTNSFNFCLKQNVDNCKVFDDFDKCKECESNFILTTDFKCEEYPFPKIENCSEYTSKETCKKCENKYYLSSDKCEKSIEIPNCDVYSQEPNTCEECSSKYFENSGSCQLRSFGNIDKCIKNWLNQDGCEICDLGYESNNTNQKCYPYVENCKSYHKFGTYVNCKTCNDGFFGEEARKCSKGNLTGCLTYASQTICSNCEVDYYLKSGSCETHSQLNNVFNCLSISTENLNQCSSCDKSSVSYSYSGFCMPVKTIVSGCKKYSDENTCETCFPDSSYLKDNQCIIGNINNCISYHPTENQCKQCKIDFETNQSYVAFSKRVDNKCFLGNVNISHNCKELYSYEEEESCKVCETQHYSVAHVSNKIAYCVPRTYYKLYANSLTGTADIDYEKLVFCELWDFEMQICRRCKIKKVISSLGKCEDVCGTSERLQTYNLNTSTSDEVHISKYFSCTEANENYGISGFKNTYKKCYRFEKNFDGTNELCMECDRESIGSVDFDTNKGFQSLFRYMPNDLIASYSVYNRITPIASCVSLTTSITADTTSDITKVVTIDGTISSSFNNCRFVMKIGTNSFGCVACKFGFSGEVVQDVNKDGNFIKNCLAINECEKSTFYNGLGSLVGQFDGSFFTFPFDYYTGCHKCLNNKIPTISILKNEISPTITNSKGLPKFIYPFGFAASNTDKTGLLSGTTGYVSSCQTNGMGKIGVSFCGMMEYSIDLPYNNLATSDDGSISKTANPLCIACKPGYKPIMSTNSVNSYSISACTVISNCMNSISITFNRCDICMGTNSLKYDNTAPNGLTFGLECVPSGQENCLVYNTTLTQCSKCGTGYILNSDFVCDIMDNYGCEIQGYYTKDIEKVTTHYSLTGQGCIKCSGDLISMRFSKIISTCVISQSLKPGSSSSSSFLITNCSFYGINDQNEIICSECNGISISSESRKKCFIIPNNLENCLFVLDSSTDSNINCKICQNNFYIDDFNYCITGTIQNCLQYSSKTKCKICKSGYLQTQVNDGRILCMSPNTQPCMTYDTSSALIGNLKCVLCNSNYYFSDSSELGNFPLIDCLKVPPIENCLEYNNDGGVLKSNLSCVKCSSQYYVSTSVKCSERQKQNILNCKQKNVQEDKCGECNLGYFVDSIGECEAYPFGIINCILYKDSKTCIKCEKNYFLESNLCVRSAKLVKDCWYYKAEGVCLECRSGFFENNSQCELGDAINCKTYKNKGECEECPDGYGLIPDNLFLSCIQINIANCNIPDIGSKGPNFKCLQCNVGFYVNGSFGCTAVPAQIEFCGIYETAYTCELCFNNYVLLSNRKKCVLSNEIENLIDKNCLNSFITEKPLCNICDPGFYFEVDPSAILITIPTGLTASSGLENISFSTKLKKTTESNLSKNCVACPNNQNNSCILCYPKNPSFCLMCSSGFTHSSDGKCAETNPTTSGPSGPTSVKIFSALSLISLIILFVTE